jgi:hypothetical protein
LVIDKITLPTAIDGSSGQFKYNKTSIVSPE